MASSIAASGSNLAAQIVNTFQPQYWKKENYGSEPYLVKYVEEYSVEFQNLSSDIEYAQDLFETDEYDSISHIHRIQNPYTYARFMLRKKHLKLEYGVVYQVRRYKLISKKYLNQALKYNCDSRRFGKASADYRFFPSIPDVWENYVLVVLQVLTFDEDEVDDEIIECSRDSEFYIEYVVYFN